MEEWEVDHLPDEEREEIRDIYRKKGFRGKDLDRAVEIITEDKETWVREMMIEEHGVVPGMGENPVKNAIATFIAFVIAGTLPLFPYVFQMASSWHISIAMTGFALFLVGASRTWITRKYWLWGGIEMLLVGAIAASVAFGVGWGIERYIL